MFEDVTTWIESHGLWNLAVGVPAFLVLFSLLSWIRRRIFKVLRAHTESTQHKLDEALLQQLETPFRLLAFVVALAFALQLTSPGLRSHPVVVSLPKLLFVSVGVWILDRISGVLLQFGVIPVGESLGTRIVIHTLGRAILFSIGLLIILDTLGISITPLLASLGVGSVAVALALQDTLGNFFSGIYLLVDKPIRLGDFVRLSEGLEGNVIKIGWRSTHIRLLGNNMVIIPNSKLSTSTVTNFDLPDQEVSVSVPVRVSYDSDLERVERVTIDLAKEVMKGVPGAVQGFDPSIRYESFGESGIHFSVSLRANRYVDQFLIKHEFLKALHARYKREKIDIPFPHRIVHLQKMDEKNT